MFSEKSFFELVLKKNNIRNKTTLVARRVVYSPFNISVEDSAKRSPRVGL